MDDALVGEGAHYEAAMSRLVTTLVQGDDFVAYLRDIHRYIVSAMREGLQWNVEPLATRLGAMAIEPNTFISEQNVIVSIPEADSRGMKRSARLEVRPHRFRRPPHPPCILLLCI